jgi:hypothetical protein
MMKNLDAVENGTYVPNSFQKYQLRSYQSIKELSTSYLT